MTLDRDSEHGTFTHDCPSVERRKGQPSDATNI
jgi:hypothetical protein